MLLLTEIVDGLFALDAVMLLVERRASALRLQVTVIFADDCAQESVQKKWCFNDLSCCLSVTRAVNILTRSS
jgi:hypothetical protein